MAINNSKSKVSIIDDMPADEFRNLVRLIVDSEREVNGAQRTKTMNQLSHWVATGAALNSPWTDENMMALKFSGLMTLVYRRVRDTGQ